MKRTLKERLEAGLQSMGYVKIGGGSRKYTTFYKEGMKKIFVGKAGALRSGQSATISRSLGSPMIITPIYQKVLAAGDVVLAGTKPAN